MKSKIIIIITTLLFCVSATSWAQKDTSSVKKTPNQVKVDESIARIKKEIELIKNNIDSAKLREMASQLEKSAEEIGDAIEDIADEVEKKAEEIEERVEKMEGKNGKNDDNDDKSVIGTIKSKKGKATISTSSKVSRRTKMYFDLGLGLNALQSNNTVANTFYPETKVWGSRYWDFGLKFRTRLGGAHSPASISYGLSYLRNRLAFSNNAKVTATSNTDVTFSSVANATRSTALTIGYVTVPLSLDFKVGRKGKFGVGGYAGYRVRTKQDIEYKVGNEEVEESRSGNYGLNNVMYGVSTRLGIGGLVLTGRLNLSPLFAESTTYDYNMYSLGLNFGF